MIKLSSEIESSGKKVIGLDLKSEANEFKEFITLIDDLIISNNYPKDEKDLIIEITIDNDFKPLHFYFKTTQEYKQEKTKWEETRLKSPFDSQRLVKYLFFLCEMIEQYTLKEKTWEEYIKFYVDFEPPVIEAGPNSKEKIIVDPTTVLTRNSASEQEKKLKQKAKSESINIKEEDPSEFEIKLRESIKKVKDLDQLYHNFLNRYSLKDIIGTAKKCLLSDFDWSVDIDTESIKTFSNNIEKTYNFLKAADKGQLSKDRKENIYYVTDNSINSKVVNKKELPVPPGIELQSLPTEDALKELADKIKKETINIITKQLISTINEMITAIEQECKKNEENKKKNINDAINSLAANSDKLAKDKINLLDSLGLLNNGFGSPQSEEEKENINVNLSEFLDDLSIILNPVEICRAINGYTDDDTLTLISSLIKNKYLKYFKKLNSKIKIKDFMLSIGTLLPSDFCSSISTIPINNSFFCHDDKISTLREQLISSPDNMITDISKMLEEQKLKRIEDKLKLLDKIENFSNGDVGLPKSNKPFICENSSIDFMQEESFKSMFDKTLLIVYEQIDSSFKKDISSYDDILLKETQTEVDIPIFIKLDEGQEQSEAADNYIWNPQLVKLQSEGNRLKVRIEGQVYQLNTNAIPSEASDFGLLKDKKIQITKTIRTTCPKTKNILSNIENNKDLFKISLDEEGIFYELILPSDEDNISKLKEMKSKLESWRDFSEKEIDDLFPDWKIRYKLPWPEYSDQNSSITDKFIIEVFSGNTADEDSSETLKSKKEISISNEVSSYIKELFPSSPSLQEVSQQEVVLTNPNSIEPDLNPDLEERLEFDSNIEFDEEPAVEEEENNEIDILTFPRQLSVVGLHARKKWHEKFSELGVVDDEIENYLDNIARFYTAYVQPNLVGDIVSLISRHISNSILFDSESAVGDEKSGMKIDIPFIQGIQWLREPSEQEKLCNITPDLLMIKEFKKDAISYFKEDGGFCSMMSQQKSGEMNSFNKATLKTIIRLTVRAYMVDYYLRGIFSFSEFRPDKGFDPFLIEFLMKKMKEEMLSMGNNYYYHFIDFLYLNNVSRPVVPMTFESEVDEDNVTVPNEEASEEREDVLGPQFIDVTDEDREEALRSLLIYELASVSVEIRELLLRNEKYKQRNNNSFSIHEKMLREWIPLIDLPNENNELRFQDIESNGITSTTRNRNVFENGYQFDLSNGNLFLERYYHVIFNKEKSFLRILLRGVQQEKIDDLTLMIDRAWFSIFSNNEAYLPIKQIKQKINDFISSIKNNILTKEFSDEHEFWNISNFIKSITPCLRLNYLPPLRQEENSSTISISNIYQNTDFTVSLEAPKGNVLEKVKKIGNKYKSYYIEEESDVIIRGVRVSSKKRVLFPTPIVDVTGDSIFSRDNPISLLDLNYFLWDENYEGVLDFLREKMISSKEYKTIFNFSIPLNRFEAILTTYTIMSVSSQEDVEIIFSNTKDKLKAAFSSLFSSNYREDIVENSDIEDFFNKLGNGEITPCIKFSFKGEISIDPKFNKSSFKKLSKVGYDLALKFIRKTPEIIWKNFVEATDPLIKASKLIVDLAKFSGNCIPIGPVAMSLFPVNYGGWGPAITNQGIAYLVKYGFNPIKEAIIEIGEDLELKKTNKDKDEAKKDDKNTENNQCNIDLEAKRIEIAKIVTATENSFQTI